MDGSDAQTSLVGSATELRNRIESRRRGLEHLARRDGESRREAGAYYTPDCVVDYIVRNAIGPLLADRTPREAAGLSVLDPACGTGSFLTGAYQYLLDWHRDRYLAESCKPWASGSRARLHRAPDGRWRLTMAERQRILLGSVFGVDIDPSAVEAARLALVLRMLADASPPPQGTTAANADEPEARLERIVSETLDRLAANIRCGDVLIDPDAVSGMIGDSGGGFDAVVGNPPYRRERGSKHLWKALANTEFGRKYRTPRMDFWYYFFHRGLQLLRPGGVLSFIVSAYWTSGTGAEKLVKALRDEAHLEEVFVLDDLPIFSGVAGRHAILRVVKQADGRPTCVRRLSSLGSASVEDVLAGKLPLVVFQKTPEQLFRGHRMDLEPPADELLARIDQWPRLGDLGVVRQGIAENPASINARTNAAFGNRWRVGEGVFALRAEEVASLDLSPDEQSLLRPYYHLCDVQRYGLAGRPSRQLIYATPETCPEIARFPRLQHHLDRFRPIMEKRRETRNGTNRWWHLHWPREPWLWESPKIIALQFAPRPACAVSRSPAYVPFSMNVFVPSAGVGESLEYLCALLNSRLLWKWHLHHAKRRGVGLEINGRLLARTPIRRIDFSRQDERTAHDRVASLARAMSLLTQNYRSAPSAAKRSAVSSQIEAIDHQIDRLVYELYGLTESQIAEVENATRLPCRSVKSDNSPGASASRDRIEPGGGRRGFSAAGHRPSPQGGGGAIL